MTGSPSILFRCDGSPAIGFGHALRCVALADELRDVHNCRVTFAMREGPLGFEMVSQKGYPLLSPTELGQSFSHKTWLLEALGECAAQVLVLDVRDDLTRADVEGLRHHGIHIVVVDDPGERRLAADLAFYPPVLQVRRLDWNGFTGQLFTGWEWVILRREFAQRQSRVPNNGPVILVTMGGSDPKGLTLKAVEALDLLQEDFQSIILLGPGFSHGDALNALLVTARRQLEVRHNVANISSVMAQADLAVASFGVTAYELAAMGVPAIYLCLTDDHADSASAFEQVGIAKSLGKYSGVSSGALAQAIHTFLNDHGLRAQISSRASAIVDGCGMTRVAQQIVAAVTNRKGSVDDETASDCPS